MNSHEKFLVFTCTLCLVSALHSQNTKKLSQPEEQLSISATVSSDGYQLEPHSVITEDGYILTLHHIQTNYSAPRPKPAVLIYHGMTANSFSWVVLGRERSLPYMLVNQGYDVWLGNVRGNIFARNHTILSPEDPRFWKFGWHEKGYYDHPATIDYILANTNQTSLHFVGYSQSTTTFFVMASLRPEYNQKIRTMHALAPIAFMSHLRHQFLRRIGPLLLGAGSLTKMLGVFEIPSLSKVVAAIDVNLCGNDRMGACLTTIFNSIGFEYGNLNITMIPTLVRITLESVSVTEVVHYTQLYYSTRFCMFDSGFLVNLEKYGSFYPPDYPLDKVTAPIYIYHSKSDQLATLRNVQQLTKKLKNVVYNKLVPHKRWTHLDFVWGDGVQELVFNDLVNNIQNKNDNNS